MLLKEEIATVLFYFIDYQSGVILPPSLETFVNIWRYLWLSQGGEWGTAGATVTLWAEARDIAKHPTTHKAAPTTKNDSAQD